MYREPVFSFRVILNLIFDLMLIVFFVMEMSLIFLYGLGSTEDLFNF